MDSPNATNIKDFEVTGISRSGRVRKKSSKLLDFRSPDDIEPKMIKRILKVPRRKPKSEDETDESTEDIEEEDSDEGSIPSDYDSDNLDATVADMVDDGEADDNFADPKYRPSLYFSEKANKRKILKDGKMIVGKTQRNDKGKERFTAYSLWARDIRKSPQFAKKQDSASTAKLLSDMWANVPANIKMTWRRRAKRLSIKSKQNFSMDEPIPSTSAAAEAATIDPDKPSTSAAAASMSLSSNRATTIRTRKLAQQSTEIKTKPAAPIAPVKHTRRGTPTSGESGTSNTSTSSASVNHRNDTNSSSNYEETIVIGYEPIDVAAYLILLGDSLSIIGERLKEHEGQLAVSGSLSVLLDSLICSLGPLICLTTKIPGLEEKNELHENLKSTLDNIAYIMPGL